MTRKINLEEFRKKYGTEKKCLEALLEFRMPSDRRCINEFCRAPIDTMYHMLKTRKCFICKQCLIHVYPQAGAPYFHRSRLPVNDRCEILFNVLNNRHGVSASQIHRNYTGSYRTAYKALQDVRLFMGECLDKELRKEPLQIVEVDESYIPTGNKGLPRHFRYKRGRGSEKNSSIIGIAERHGRLKLLVIHATDADTLIPIIQDYVPVGSTIYTDSWPAYSPLKSLGYKHYTVNHSIEFVNGSASTNTMENVFSNLTRMVIGTYHNVTEGKLPYYLDEYAFRRSFREDYDYGFERLLRSLPPISEFYWDKKAIAA